jgi:hypothetical protein
LADAIPRWDRCADPKSVGRFVALAPLACLSQAAVMIALRAAGYVSPSDCSDGRFSPLDGRAHFIFTKESPCKTISMSCRRPTDASAF